jgi:hypothetical protein
MGLNLSDIETIVKTIGYVRYLSLASINKEPVPKMFFIPNMKEFI